MSTKVRPQKLIGTFDASQFQLVSQQEVSRQLPQNHIRKTNTSQFLLGEISSTYAFTSKDINRWSLIPNRDNCSTLDTEFGYEVRTRSKIDAR